jgi:hypothetical protein
MSRTRSRGMNAARMAALALVALLSIGLAGTAQAALSVELRWTDTTGAGETGSDVIVAEPGDEVTLDIIVTIDSAGVDFYTLSVVFDDDLMDELDIVETIEFEHVANNQCDPLIIEQLGPFPDCANVSLFGPELKNQTEGIVSEVESDATTAGLAEGFEAATPLLGPDAGPADVYFRVGRIVFLVTENVASDGADLEGSILTGADGYADNSLAFFVGIDDMPSPAVTPGFATVNAPEPGAAVLGAAAAATLAGLHRRRRRRGAGR